MTEELLTKLKTLPPHFFGTVEIAYQNGHPGLIRITETHKLPSRETREDHANSKFNR